MHTLYVFVNRDLSSMNEGKAQAHSGHAATKMVFDMKNRNHHHCDKTLEEWEGGRGFGTQINLEASWERVRELNSDLNKIGYGWKSSVIDPTYPFIVSNELIPFFKKDVMSDKPKDLGNGTSVCFRNQYTAFYIFVPDEREDIKEMLKEFKLAK